MRRRLGWPPFGPSLLLCLVAGLIALTWYATLRIQDAVGSTGQSIVARELRGQVSTLDHHLQTMAQAWQLDSEHFSLSTWATAITSTDERQPNLLLVNAQGVVTQATERDMVGSNVADQDWFRTGVELAKKQQMSTINAVRMDGALHWRILVAHWLRSPDYSFGGLIAADEPLEALNDLFHPTPPAPIWSQLLAPHTVLYGQAILLSILLFASAWLLILSNARAERDARALADEHRMAASTTEDLLEVRSNSELKAAQLEAVLAGMSDGIAVLDADLRLQEWNEQFAELAGIPRRLLHPEISMEQILRAQAEAGDFGPVKVEVEVARRLGVLRSLQDKQAAERTRPDGRVIELRRYNLPNGSFIALYRDITSRRSTETAAQEARALAEAAAAAKSRLVAIVSHEIRSPLGGLLETLHLLGGSGLPPAQQALLRMAQQSGDALFGLINDILDMSSMEAGQLMLRPSVFPLKPLLDGVIEMFQAQAAERGIALRLAVDPQVPEEMYADPGRVRQVLINLISNAVKFGIPGPVMLLAGLDRDEQGGNVLSFALRDSGPVIEQAGRARLFRPFSRLDLTGGEPLGAGLGLAICRYLVTLMGGEIGCDTWMGEDRHAGNEFWVRLPLVPVPTGAPQRSSSGAAPSGPLLPRTRILLVEDIAANQLVTALLLRREGHMVDVADTGEAALRAVSQLPYDLVFTDVHLPGMNGFDLARRIRDLPGAACAVPIVALSANTGPDDFLECERAGISDLLDKPAALADLLDALRRLVWRGLPAHTAALDSPAQLPAAPLLSEERILELRANLPPDTLRGMVQECLTELQGRLPALRRALLEGDTADAAAQTHAMLGMAAGYGMAALERRLRAAITAMQGPHEEAATTLLQQLEADLAQSGQALRQALEVELA